MEVVLNLVLLVEAWARFGRFRPEISDVVTAASLQRGQLIKLVLASRPLDDAVLAVHLAAHLSRHIPNRRAVSALAHLGPGDVGENGAGGARVIWQAVVHSAASVFGARPQKADRVLRPLV